MRAILGGKIIVAMLFCLSCSEERDRFRRWFCRCPSSLSLSMMKFRPLFLIFGIIQMIIFWGQKWGGMRARSAFSPNRPVKHLKKYNVKN